MAHHFLPRSRTASTILVRFIQALHPLLLTLDPERRYHLQSYPVTVDLTRKMGDELRDTVLNFIGGPLFPRLFGRGIMALLDSMTSPTSTAPYTLEELHSILSLANAINSE